MKAMTFHIPEDLKLQLDLHAKIKGVKIAQVVRKAITQYLRQAERRTK